MGSFISNLWWGGDPDVANPESGLSKRDIHNIRKSWAKVTVDSVASGTELLIRFFSEFPENKKFFKSFKDRTPDQLRTSIQFNAHALNIMTSISSIIENLEKPDLVNEICRKLGVSHNNRHITPTQFENLDETLVKLFRDVLKFDEATMKSWVRCVSFMNSGIFKELQSK